MAGQTGGAGAAGAGGECVTSLGNKVKQPTLSLTLEPPDHMHWDSVKRNEVQRGIFPKKLEREAPTNPCTPTLRAARFTATKRWKPRKSRRMGEQIVLYSYNGMVFSHDKEWNILAHTRVWINQKNIRLSGKGWNPETNIV